MKKSFTAFLSVLILLSTGLAHAQNEKSGQKKMGRQEQVQMQEKMAKLHSDTAACLKNNNKTVEACKAEMMKSCSMGEMHCQMMGNMMSGDMSMMDHSMMGKDGMHGMHGKTKKTE